MRDGIEFLDSVLADSVFSTSVLIPFETHVRIIFHCLFSFEYFMPWKHVCVCATKNNGGESYAFPRSFMDCHCAG